MTNCLVSEINNSQAAELNSRAEVFCDLIPLISEFACIRCADKPAWSGQINELHTSSKHFLDINKMKFAKIIIDLNQTNLIPEYEFWYQEYSQSLIIINKKKIGNWRKLSISFIEHQNFLKLLSKKKHRKIVLDWVSNKLTVERLFFKGLPLGSPSHIQSLKINNLNCGMYQVEFRSGQSIFYTSRSFELEQNFIHLSQLLGFFEIETPQIFTSSDHSWMKPIPHTTISYLINNTNLNFYFGLVYGLLFALDAHQNIITLLKSVNNSPFLPSLQVLSKGLANLDELPICNPSEPIDSQVENFIDGFTTGYRKILAMKFTNTKLENYSKLIPKQYLWKLEQLVNDSTVHNSTYSIEPTASHSIKPTIETKMSEDDLSNQIGMIREEYLPL